MPIILNSYTHEKILSFLTLALLASVSVWAYDFSAVAPSGQTLYYIINMDSATVTATYPADYSWDGFTQPPGSLAIPSTVTYNSQIYFVTSIGHAAFDDCRSITGITIPNSVTSIGNYAFKDCSGLTSITSEAYPAPRIGMDAFDGVSSAIPVNIPCGSGNSYHDRWSYFSNFAESGGHTFSATTADSAQGVVHVQTEPSCTDPTAVIYAAANTGYHFAHWSDGNADTPRTIVLTSDTAIIAYFEAAQSIEEAADKASIVIRTTGTRIMVEGAEVETVRLFDCAGRCLQTLRAAGPCTLRAPAAGAYLLQVRSLSPRKVVVL